MANVSIRGDGIMEGSMMKLNRDGNNITTRYLVENINGSTAEERLVAAINATGLPRYGQSAPGLRIFAYDFDVQFVENSPTKAWVLVTYSPYNPESAPASDNSPPELFVGASLVTKKTNFDINKNVMTVSYQKTAEVGASSATAIDVQSGTVEIQIPQPFLRFKRREPFEPSRKAEAFVGRVNITPWYGDAQFLWLCTRIEGQRRVDGSFDVQYEFLRNDDTWDATIVYVDPQTGKTPSDVLEGTGIKNYAVYKRADFNALALGV